MGLLISGGTRLSPLSSAQACLAAFFFPKPDEWKSLRAKRFENEPADRKRRAVRPAACGRREAGSRAERHPYGAPHFCGVDGKGGAAVGFCSSVSLAQLAKFLRSRSRWRAAHRAGAQSRRRFIERILVRRKRPALFDLGAKNCPRFCGGRSAADSLGKLAGGLTPRRTRAKSFGAMRTFGGFLVHGSTGLRRGARRGSAPAARSLLAWS